MGIFADNLTRLFSELTNSLKGVRARLPGSVNPPNPSNEISDFDSGWSSQGASYRVPQRKRQRQPFKWG